MNIRQDVLNSTGVMLQLDGTEGQMRSSAPLSDVVLEIFVSQHCFVCEYAYEVAAMIRRDFPTVRVSIIDIHQTTEPIPERVFATPTYLLNGEVWSLGNPSIEKIVETLSEVV